MSDDNQQPMRASDRIRQAADALEKLEDSAIEKGDPGGIQAVRAIGVAMLISLQEIGQEVQKAVAKEEEKRNTPSES